MCLCLQIQEVLAKFMENAVRFELDSRKLRINYQLSVGETTGIALSTVLEAMEVFLANFVFYMNHLFLSYLSFDCSRFFLGDWNVRLWACKSS